MTKDAARADRAHAARAQARAWQRAGLLDAGAVAVVEREWPDDRRRFGPVLRVLAFGFTVLATGAAFALVLELAGRHSDDTIGILALVFAGGLIASTELLKGPLRLCDAGLEAATGLLASLAFSGGAIWLLSKLGPTSVYSGLVALLVAASAYAAASLRWGSTTSALVATACLAGALAQLPGARLSWALAALILVPLTLRGERTPALPPSHRRSCQAVSLLALVGLYVALHLGSYDRQLLEDSVIYVHRELAHRWLFPRGLFVVATTLVPIAVLALGLLRRRRTVLLLGAVLGAASLVTLRFYVHVAPLWLVLCASGAALVFLALGLRRWLDAGPGRERNGFTAEALAGDERGLRLLETAVAVAAVSPTARARGSAAEPFEAGGGGFGGGGASEKF
jgi:hypothetical protein